MTLRSRALTGLTQFVLTLGVLLFGSAWSLRYWQAWAFLAAFGVSVTAITLYLLQKDPALLERRMRAGPGAEKEKSQKVIQVVANIPSRPPHCSGPGPPVWLVARERGCRLGGR